MLLPPGGWWTFTCLTSSPIPIKWEFYVFWNVYHGIFVIDIRGSHSPSGGIVEVSAVVWVGILLCALPLNLDRCSIFLQEHDGPKIIIKNAKILYFNWGECLVLVEIPTELILHLLLGLLLLLLVLFLWCRITPSETEITFAS